MTSITTIAAWLFYVLFIGVGVAVLCAAIVLLYIGTLTVRLLYRHCKGR